MEPPLPISNREVKLFSADNSYPETDFENRSWPELREQIDSTDCIICLFGADKLLSASSADDISRKNQKYGEKNKKRDCLDGGFVKGRRDRN